MPAVEISPVVRAVMGSNVNMLADDVMKKVRLKGVTASDKSIRDAIYNVKSAMRKAAAKSGAPRTIPAAARATKPAPAPKVVAAPAPEVVPEEVAPTPVPVATSSGPDLGAVLANVALVNTVVGACGGAEPARKVAEAVKACGGVEAFLQHLDLVAGIRGGAST